MKQYLLEACSIMKLYEAQMSYKMNWTLHKVGINKSYEMNENYKVVPLCAQLHYLENRQDYVQF